MPLSTFSPHRLLGIEGLPHAMRFSVLQGILLLSWALPSAPWLIYAFGRPAVFWFGTGCIIASSFCLSFDQTAFLVTGAAARSLGYMWIDVTFEVMIMERIPRHALTRFETARMFCIGIGLLIGPWLGVKLMLDFDAWATYSLVGALIGGLCLYITQAGLTNSLCGAGLRQTAGQSTRKATGLASEQAVQQAPPYPFRFILLFLRQPRLRLAWILSFGRAGWWTMFFIYVPIYCVQTGLGAELGGVILLLAALAMLLVPIWGRLAQRIGVRWLLWLGYLITGVTTLAVAAVAAVASPWFGVGLLLAASVSASLLDAVGNALFLRAARPLERAEMASVFLTYRETAQLIPPGILAGLLGFFALPVVFVASGCGMVALTWLTRHIPRRS